MGEDGRGARLMHDDMRADMETRDADCAATMEDCYGTHYCFREGNHSDLHRCIVCDKQW